MSLPPAFALEPGFWRYWTVLDGLQEAWCSAVTLSPSDHVWITHGVAVKHSSLYDGYHIRAFPKNDTHLPMFEGPDFSLWSLTRGNTLRYFPDWRVSMEGEWTDHSLNPANGYPVLIPVSKTQALYLSVDQRLIEYDVELQAGREILEATRTNLGSLNGIFPGRDRCVWLSGSRGLGRWRAGEGNRLEEFPYPSAFSGQTAVFQMESRRGFVQGYLQRDGNQASPMVFDGRGFTVDPHTFDLSGNALVREDQILIPVRDHVLLAGRENMMAALINHAFFEDDGKVWYATNQGLARYCLSIWQTPLEVANIHSIVHGIHEHPDDSLWFICRNQFARLKDGQWETHLIPPGFEASYYVTGAIGSLPDGRIYYSTDRSIIAFDPATRQFEVLIESTPYKLRYYLKQEGPDRLLVTEYAAPDYSLGLFDGKTYTPLIQESGSDRLLSGVRDSLVDRNHVRWVAGLRGALRFENGVYRPFPEGEQPPFGAASCLMETRDGRIWAGGSNSIWQFDGRHWSLVRDNLDRVNHIVQMADDSIWVASFSGLHQYKDGTWITYTSEDGLSNTSVYTVYQDKQGRIWAGTTSGIVMFHPEEDPDPPLAWIDPNNSREIAPSGNAQFFFSGVDKWNFTKPERLYFACRIDKEPWSSFSTHTVVQVRNLASGSHRLYVRAMDRNWNRSETAAWDFTVPLPWYKEPGFWAISSLGGTLTLILAALAVSRHRQVQKSNLKLQEANLRLNRANEELRELDKMKSAFVAQASHDLRTPLTAIQGSLDNLAHGVGGGLNEKQQVIIGRASRSVKRLTNLINDILDISRIESGRMILDLNPVSLKLLTESILQEEKSAAAQKNISLSMVAAEEPPRIRVDASKIERIIGELISNAIKYTPEDGSIEVRLAQTDTSVYVAVQDTGIGMAPEEIPKIWERFYRTTASRKIAKGSGLGLSIAKELVELHEGTITVESEAGKGSTFTVTLPKR
ncbi:MAG: ATP-binding protein [bacterium]